MTTQEVKEWLEILIQDYIYEDVEDTLIEMRNIIYDALDDIEREARSPHSYSS